jgi:hypothetical protein
VPGLDRDLVVSADFGDVGIGREVVEQAQVVSA